MTKGILSALAVLTIAMLGYCFYFNWATSKAGVLASAESEDVGLSWVKTEFGLSDSQFSQLKAANAEYAPRCEAMCAQLAQARRALATLVEAPTTQEADVEGAYANVSDVERQCVNMTLQHIYTVSALMKPEESARYRKQMIAQLMGHRTSHHRLHADIVRTRPPHHASE